MRARSYLIGLCLAFLGGWTHPAQAQTILFGAMYRFDDPTVNGNAQYNYSVAIRFSVLESDVALMPPTLTISLYRRRDNRLINKFEAWQIRVPNADQARVPCENDYFRLGSSYRVDYRQIQYVISPVLLPQDYQDNEGYFFVNDPVGQRYRADNIQTAPVVLYHAFWPEFLVPINDGSLQGYLPVTVSGGFQYACADSRLVAPLSAFTRRPVSPPSTEVKFLLARHLTTGTPFRSVNFQSEFSEPGQFRGGSWSFSQTTYPSDTRFQSNLTPTGNVAAGTYAIAAIVEQYRSGRKLSESTFESLFSFVPCPSINPSNVTVSEVGKPTVPASLTFCEGQAVQLNGGNRRSRQVYEWIRDDVPLANSNDSILVVNRPGRYRIRIGQRDVCDVFRSEEVILVSRSAGAPPVIEGDTVLCPGRPTSLSAVASAGATYQWLLNGQPIASATRATYQTNQTGLYTVQIVDANGCRQRSTNRTLITGQPITVQMDSIPPTCLPTSRKLRLSASPAGGRFSGPGVANDEFNPELVNPGRHMITYRPASNSALCLLGTPRRVAVVQTPAELRLPSRLETPPSQPIALGGDLGPDYRYAWQPPDALSNPTSANPTATPAATTTYQLTVTDRYGCTTTDTVRVDVVQRVFIPNAFSPNGDGLNDTWVLAGIGEFPEATVEVFSRWGEVVFRTASANTAPFDGQYLGQRLPPGIYTYRIQLRPNRTALRGSLLLTR